MRRLLGLLLVLAPAARAQPDSAADGGTSQGGTQDGGAPTTTSTARPTLPPSSGPTATLAGFEMLGEGGSRFFVEISQTVQVEERRSPGTVTYVLRRTHVPVRNNRNPLVTVHFNTPATTARLVPAGADVWFVISLRSNVMPTWKMNPGKEGSAVLNIDFPKGSYLQGS